MKSSWILWRLFIEEAFLWSEQQKELVETLVKSKFFEKFWADLFMENRRSSRTESVLNELIKQNYEAIEKRF